MTPRKRSAVDRALKYACLSGETWAIPALKAAKRDKDRLDWLLSSPASEVIYSCRASIDAAMRRSK